MVPMVAGGVVRGLIALSDFEREDAFDDSHVRLLQTLAASMAVALENARLFAETQRLLKETEQRNAELAVINSIQQGMAAELSFQGIVDLVGDKLRDVLATESIGIRWFDPDTGLIRFLYEYEHGKRMHVEPMARVPGGPGEVMERTRRPVVLNTPEERAAAGISDLPGTDPSLSVIFIPILGPDRLLGTIVLEDYHREHAYGEAEVRLLGTVAAGMGVALENARLFDQTQRLLKETERGERESSALSDVGRDLSSSLDLSVVMDRIAHHARDLLQATDSAIFLPDRGAATHRATVAIGDDAEAIKVTAIEAGVGIICTLLQDGEAELINDIDADPRARHVAGTTRGSDERLMVVPLRAGTQVLGAMAVWRNGGRPFEARELEFLVGLSRQATLALQNARLFNETADALTQVEQQARDLSESLDYQTAISEVLRVMSQSSTDVAPVFEAILDCATRLFGSAVAAIYRYDGRLVELVATRHWPARALELAGTLYPAPPAQAQLAGQVILSGQAIGLDDALVDPTYNHALAAAGGWRRTMGAPMLKDGVAVGAILVAWPDAGHTSARQIELIRTFADQAVIAIENVRLLNETKEALERQTATAEVLKVIAASPDDVQPVFDAIAASSNRLLSGHSTAAWRIRDGAMHLVGFTPTTPEGDAALLRLSGTPLVRVAFGERVLAGETVCVTDTEDEFQSAPPARDVARARGYRSMVISPLRRDDVSIGMLNVTRREPGEFTPHQIELLETFAAQAVIAIQNVQMFNETQEALERQTATADVLRVLGSSMTETQPVFDAIVRNGGELLSGSRVVLWLTEGNVLRARASNGGLPSEPIPIDHESPVGACVADARTIHLPNLAEAAERYPRLRQLALGSGFQSGIYAPLLRNGVAIGGLAVLRREKGAFEAKDVALVDTFVDQASIAIENTRLFNETKEALEQQTATAEILRVISGSITDTQPVFEAIVQSCRHLFGGKSVHLAMPRGDMIEDVAFASDGPSPKGIGFLKPWPLDRGSGAGTCILEGRVISVADTVEGAKQFPRMPDLAIALGYRSCLFVPLLRDGKALGSLTILRESTGEFDAQEVALAQTFADQAVIAIENARLFDETQKALERQIATSEVLKVISSSPTDVQPVLDALAERAGLLCHAEVSRVWLVFGDELRAMTSYGPERIDEELPLRASSISGRAVLEGRSIHVEDVLPLIDSDYPDVRVVQSRLGSRSVLAVPMMREGRAIGVITLLRFKVHPFAPAEIALLKTFADQAVIAIQNTRLFNETQEALERQTATSEILKVIAGSPADVQPVFDAIVRNAVAICDGMFASVFRYDGELLHWAASHKLAPAAVEMLRATYPVRPDPSQISGRVVLTRAVAHTRDAIDEPDYDQRFAIAGRWRRMLGVPMMRDGKPVGVIVVGWRDAGEILAHHEELLRTFADQAVIAIQNARLWNETQDALEQQTATAEVLQVISSSVADAAPVFDKILDSGQHLFASEQLGIFLLEDDGLVHAAAWRGSALEAFMHTFPKRPEDTLTARVIRERRVVQIDDAAAMTDAPAAVRGIVGLIGSHSVVMAPMLWEDSGIGSIGVLRQPPQPFSDKEINLLKTFADQAVIAIQNARRFRQAQRRTRRRRSRQRGQELVPRHHEPRDPHADERRDRHERPAARHVAQRRAARLRRHHPRLGRGAADDHQRHPRLLEDRGRSHGDRVASVGPARVHRVRARPDRRARGRKAARHRLSVRGRGAARRGRRRHAAAPGAAQPTEQLGQVHRSGRGRADGVGQRRRAALCRERHRHRPERLRQEPPVPELQPGRQQHDAQVRRHRTRAGDQQAARRADGRHDVGGKPRPRPRLDLPLHDARARGRAAGRSAPRVHRGAAGAARQAHPGGRRQRDQPAHPGAADGPLGHGRRRQRRPGARPVDARRRPLRPRRRRHAHARHGRHGAGRAHSRRRPRAAAGAVQLARSARGGRRPVRRHARQAAAPEPAVRHARDPAHQRCRAQGGAARRHAEDRRHPRRAPPAAHPSGRRQRRQPEAGPAPAAADGLSRRPGIERHRGDRINRAPALRRRPDGCTDARDGRTRSDPAHHGPLAERQPAAHRRHDRQRDAG